MSLKSFFIFSIPALGLLHSCATANNWQNDDVYTMKEPEVPIGTDINDETDYAAYVYNRRSLDRQQQYYSDRQPAAVSRSSYMAMGPSMYMMSGPYGMGMGYGFGYGSPYGRYGYNPYGGYYGGYGYSPYYGYGSPYYGYGSPYYSPYYGYGSPYYGGYSPYGYGYSPYGYSPYGYGYGAYSGYGYGGNYYGNSGSSGSYGNTHNGHRGTYAGVGGTSSRPNGAVQIAKPNVPGGGNTKPVGNGSVAEKSVSRGSLASNQSAREVSGLSTPGTNRPTVASGAVRSQSGFNTRPPVARTTDHVRPTAPVNGGYTPAGRMQNPGRTNSGNGNVSAPRNYESRPVMSAPARTPNPGGNFGGGGSRPSMGGGGAVRSGGGGGGRR